MLSNRLYRLYLFVFKMATFGGGNFTGDFLMALSFYAERDLAFQLSRMCHT